ncbi:hypothetical protein A2Y85_04050 [candidate division WOR-3 bacterium RBG_13_43_14]|uniref:GH84 domain-containing protein n=1 Tax=candidate division WOR-3 bacterium RBG_13_43_14 TaxID=1802590 RepID=A0A1F4U9M0_UNCW3|nr:MAG: hypothetical protein A2Y85_04050 [candidate division WOR-3 bacterium RBG_13_43_14]
MRAKYFGVIEGFYGKPYTFKERIDLIAFLAETGQNTYVYGPKDDPRHRRSWRKPYSAAKIKEFKYLSRLSLSMGIHFNYALSPMNDPDYKAIISKIKQLIDIGIRNFSLFYDDINIELNGFIAGKQTKSANMLYLYLKKYFKNPILFFCPTQYRGFHRSQYIRSVAVELLKQIEIFWTGNRVVSKRITGNDVKRITRILKRPPLIWDNIFANDYIPGKIWRQPYNNRSAILIQKTRGILINPMNEYWPSKPLIYTAARFFASSSNYRPKKVWGEIKRYFNKGGR